MSLPYDIAILGSGYAGSLMAMVATRLGYSVLLLERGQHPRITIGESSTPLANLLLEELATRYQLPSLQPLTKWGPWQRTYPHIACGLKRGFTFYHHPENPIHTAGSQLLVAASPHDEIADTHWFRADFDSFLVAQAQSLGVHYLDHVTLHTVTETPTAITLTGTRQDTTQDTTQTWQARFLIDATGPNGFLQRTLSIPPATFPHYPATQTLYNHFTGVTKPEIRPASSTETPPYPPEDAAVHHVFDGGWVWVLRFNNGITSAGIAADRSAANRLNLAQGAPAWQRLLQSIPTLADQFQSAQPIQPFTYRPAIASLSSQLHGHRWAMLPSAAGFIDPLFSTGFPLTLLGIGRLAQILPQILHQPQQKPDSADQLAHYAQQTTAELHATARLIAALYANMHRFPVFRAISLLYFAAASYSESARRLNKHHLATAFLLHDHPQFGPASSQILRRALHLPPGEDPLAQNAIQSLIHDIHTAIEPIDIAGLTRPNPQNWYPARAEDLLQSASKLHATPAEIESLLQSSGFYQPTPS